MNLDIPAQAFIIFLCFTGFILFLNLGLVFAWRNRSNKLPTITGTQKVPLGWKRDELQMKELSEQIHNLGLEKPDPTSDTTGSNQKDFPV
jgi:hypothetical protein